VYIRVAGTPIDRFGIASLTISGPHDPLVSGIPLGALVRVSCHMSLLLLPMLARR
jgi:hypothetical protein